jgi:threonine dehydratase
MTASFAISPEDVVDAARLLKGAAVVTPLLENAALNAVAGGRVLVKFEGAQHSGSFKFRGAYNRLARLSPAQRAAGVVAWSSGNHAQGVAFAARLLNIPAAIVMPADAPRIKADNTRALGAEVIPYDRFTESREEIATRLSQERGATLVPSFDDPHVMAGQGTAGLEILEQAQTAGAALSQILVCCGGGGLVSGIATAVKASRADIAIHAVEPDGFDDTARSLRSGVRESVDPAARSICDALMAPSPGELTFPINHHLLTGGIAVSDAEVRAAMRFAFTHLKIVAEPGGAVALAAVLAGKAPETGGDRAIVISGANVDPQMFAEIIGSEG